MAFFTYNMHRDRVSLMHFLFLVEIFVIEYIEYHKMAQESFEFQSLNHQEMIV